MTKPGLRLRVLLLLGGLVSLTFLPLQLALWAHTQVALQRLDEAHDQSIAIGLKAFVRRFPAKDSSKSPLRELWQQANPWGLAAGVLPSNLESAVGPPQLVQELLRADISPERWQTTHTSSSTFRLIELAQEPRLRVALHSGRAAARGPGLVQAFGLYAVLISGGLLVVSFLALTRWLVRPLDRLARSAQGVTLGSRHLNLPSVGIREVDELGASVQRMAARLLNEEDSLRRKVQEVERATNDLKAAQAQLVRSERLASVGRLSAGLAHEIGNPLAALTGLADLMLEGGLTDSEQQDFLQRMRSETTRIHNTLSELLQFARPSGAIGEPSVTPGNVEAAVNENVVLISHQASLKKVNWTVDLCSPLPAVALGDPALRQVLMNLLLNAADAVQDQERPQVTISARSDGREVAIHVQDNGPGVSEGVAEKVFDPFFTTKDVGKGTGLGLSVCQGLVAAAGGSLSLEPQPTAGAHFAVRLPVSLTETDSLQM